MKTPGSSVKGWLLMGGLLAVGGLAVTLLIQSRGSAPLKEPLVKPKPIDFPVAAKAPPQPQAPAASEQAPPPAAKSAEQRRQERYSSPEMASFRETMLRKLREHNVDPSKLPKITDPYAKYKDPKERELARVTNEQKEFPEVIRGLKAQLAENDRLKVLTETEIKEIKRKIFVYDRMLDISKWRLKNLNAGVWPEPTLSDYPGYKKW